MSNNNLNRKTVYLYHERQVAALCGNLLRVYLASTAAAPRLMLKFNLVALLPLHAGQHCLNNLLQGPYFTEIDLGEIAQELDRAERALMFEAGDTAEARAFAREESANVSADGNFSIQVLNTALERGHGITLEDTRRPENRNFMLRPETQNGFVLNRSAHWYCLRKLDNQWWQCNSTQPAPEKVSDRELASTLAGLKSDNWTIFLVKGTLPPPTPRNSNMIPAWAGPQNWVDPANPPSDGTGFGGGLVSGGQPKKEEPKFQAFTGGGNRLGGLSSGGGSGGGGGGGGNAMDGKSEDEQLAMALALSSTLANKARIEARLPAEPETGAGAARVLVRMPDGKRCQRRFPNDAPITALIDYVCVELCDAGSVGNKWQLASQYPPMKLQFNADGTSDDRELRQQTFTSAGLAPSAQLHVSAC